MFRRLAVIAVLLTMVALLGYSGTGSAAPTSVVMPSQQWTFEVDNGGGCELFDIGAKHSWTDVHFPNDFGTYSGGGKSITVQWGDKSLTFEGHYFPSAKEYIGLITGNDIAQLVSGYVTTWDGVPC
jgi:hypothetical protein